MDSPGMESPVSLAPSASPQAPVSPSHGRACAAWVKGVASLLILYHLAGLVLSPATVPPSSSLSRNLFRGFMPYLKLVFMNHGFHFFAPNPSASTIVRYTVHRDDGQEVVGQIPDKSQHRPRLLYHRHFMVTEFLAQSESRDPILDNLAIRAVARQLCREHGGSSVTLKKVIHRLPSMEWIRAGKPLDDPLMFDETTVGRFYLGDL